LWHYMDGYNTWDYGLIKVNGTTVWGTSALADFQPWQELTVNLAAYGNMASVEISFEWYATSTVSYAGWYIDDIYIGNPPSRPVTGERWFLNYDVYRFLAADEGIPENWTLLQSGVADTTYLDTGFGAQAAGSYKWAVKANYSGALQSEAIISNALGIVALPVIDEPTVGVVGNTVTFGWQAQPGATYYTLYGSDDPYAAWPWTIIGYSATPVFNYNGASVPYKFFKVTASDGEMPPQP